VLKLTFFVTDGESGCNQLKKEKQEDRKNQIHYLSMVNVSSNEAKIHGLHSFDLLSFETNRIRPSNLPDTAKKYDFNFVFTTDLA